MALASEPLSTERPRSGWDGGLRLLILVPSAVPGGMEEIVYNLAVCLPQTGVHVEVISLEDGPLVRRLASEGVPTRVFDAGRLRDGHQVVRTVARLARALRAGHFDAVFSDMPKAHVYAAFAARRAGVPALWCQAGHPDPAHWIDRLATTLPADRVVALSRDAVEAQRRLGPRGSVELLHPGLDLERFTVADDPDLRRRAAVPLDAPLVSLVGRLQPWKGQREFLRSAAIVLRSHPSTYFAVVGGAILGWEGDYPRELERLAKDLGIEERVIFTGHTDEVPRWMAASDIVVNASDPEPFGLVVIEAMAAGCAAVALNTGGPRDIIEHGRTGLLCEARDPDRLAEAVGRLVGDRTLRQAMGAAARQRVEVEFSRERSAERFVEILRRTVRAHQARS